MHNTVCTNSIIHIIRMRILLGPSTTPVPSSPVPSPSKRRVGPSTTPVPSPSKRRAIPSTTPVPSPSKRRVVPSTTRVPSPRKTRVRPSTTPELGTAQPFYILRVLRKRIKPQPEIPTKKRRIDKNKCQICHKRFQVGREDECVGCDSYPRWFHKICVENPDIKKK